MKRFVTGQRVAVKQVDDIALNALGTVERVRVSDECALDTRSKMNVHPFKADDPTRSAHVLAHPDDCEIAKENSRGRRAATRAAKEPAAAIEVFGKDHWSTFAYIEVRCTDHGGIPDRRHMRCNGKRHPLLAHVAGPCPPTRLKGGITLENHDDWDCADDLAAAGLIECFPSITNWLFRMTEEGNRVAGLLCVFKQSGGNFASFSPAGVEFAHFASVALR